MTFEQEVLAAFGEVGKQAMPVRYRISNAEFTGVITTDSDEFPMNESGYEAQTTLRIMSDRGQWDANPVTWPQAGSREIVQVLEGPFLGKWVLTDVKPDLAHFTLICSISE